MKRSPIRKRRRTKHQLANVDHREYVEWCHTQPCAACGTRQNIHAAHVGRGGMGMKHGSDAEVIPLCGANGSSFGLPGCHADHDQYHGRFGGEFYETDAEWRARRRAWDAHQIAIHRGRFEARHIGEQDLPF